LSFLAVAIKIILDSSPFNKLLASLMENVVCKEMETGNGEREKR
jgi:hypothetical protein